VRCFLESENRKFYEYLHGDTGAGLGASHQTGWTGFIARAMHVFASVTAEQFLEGGKKSYAEAAAQKPSGQRGRPAKVSS